MTTPIHINGIRINKIQAIRIVREVTGLGLYESKVAVEALLTDEACIAVLATTSCVYGQHDLSMSYDAFASGAWEVD